MRDLHTEMMKSLYRWHRENRRDLPFRNTGDPYRIWVSEVMLQQTRVESMVGPYCSFMERFPDVGSLAGSEEGQVLSAWRGLGYYSRAKNLRKGAIQIVNEYDGAFPRTPTDALKIAGVGEYTAAAVLSLAFGVPVAAVDGNVRRVLSRLFDIPDGGRARIREIADRLMMKAVAPPGMHNEALMEFGAVICAPGRPLCEGCPVSGACASHRRGGEDYARGIPSTRSQKLVSVLMNIYLIRDVTGRFLIRRDPASHFLKGHWFYPHSIVILDEDESPPVRKESPAHSRSAQGPSIPGHLSDSVTHIPDAFMHTITRHRIRADLYLIDHSGIHATEEGLMAVSSEDAGALIVSSMQSKIERAIERSIGE